MNPYGPCWREWLLIMVAILLFWGTIGYYVFTANG